MASGDAEKMHDMVRELGRRVEFHFGPGSDPYLDIFVELVNCSVFTVTTFGEIAGHSLYGGRPLATDPRIIDVAALVFFNLKHGEAGTLRIRQFVSRDTAELMWAERSRNAALDLGNVAISFRTMLVGFPVGKFRWYGPQITIEEATRLSE